jgi:hypothetical protein
MYLSLPGKNNVHCLFIAIQFPAPVVPMPRRKNECKTTTTTMKTPGEKS